MKNFYQELHKVINNEINARESMLETQRQSKETQREATEVTKEVIGVVLESIERKWGA